MNDAGRAASPGGTLTTTRCGDTARAISRSCPSGPSPFTSAARFFATGQLALASFSSSSIVPSAENTAGVRSRTTCSPRPTRADAGSSGSSMTSEPEAKPKMPPPPPPAIGPFIGVTSSRPPTSDVAVPAMST